MPSGISWPSDAKYLETENQSPAQQQTTTLAHRHCLARRAHEGGLAVLEHEQLVEQREDGAARLMNAADDGDAARRHAVQQLHHLSKNAEQE